MNSAELHQAFIQTRYIIKAGKEFPAEMVLQIGEPTSQLEELLPHLQTWAFVTAYNPLPDILSQEENEKRHQQLCDYLSRHAIRYYAAVGISSDGTWQEESLFIENISEKNAIQTAEYFGQLAIVFGYRTHEAKLLYTQKGL